MEQINKAIFTTMLDVTSAINQIKSGLGHRERWVGVLLNKVDRNKGKQSIFSSPKVHLDK